jgi:uncharacterized membrane protein HdeD (DUF308 family)
MKFLSYFFRFLTIIGFFLLVAGMAGSHGHFKFRPHMTEDWIIFGTPIVGILGWVLTGLMSEWGDA